MRALFAGLGAGIDLFYYGTFARMVFGRLE